MSSEREKTLVMKFKEFKEKVSFHDNEKKEAQKELDNIERELLELLQVEEKESTARYEGLGFVSQNSPVVRANCRKENISQLFEFLRSEGRQDLIKENVHPQALSSYVTEMLAAGKEPPEFISYFLQTKLRFYAR